MIKKQSLIVQFNDYKTIIEFVFYKLFYDKNFNLVESKKCLESYNMLRLFDCKIQEVSGDMYVWDSNSQHPLSNGGLYPAATQPFYCLHIQREFNIYINVSYMYMQFPTTRFDCKIYAKKQKKYVTNKIWWSSWESIPDPREFQPSTLPRALGGYICNCSLRLVA